MSLGYVKGRYWVPDERYAAYAQRDSFKALIRATTAARITTNVEYSYASRLYCAEIQTIERFEKSSHCYVIKHNNAYHTNPVAALSQALREYPQSTPRVLVACLEIECELLLETYRAAVRREKLEAKLDGVLDTLQGIISAYTFQGIGYECENCIGMIEHGCYCAAMGCTAPGGPSVQDRLDRTRAEATSQPYDLDDDL